MGELESIPFGSPPAAEVVPVQISAEELALRRVRNANSLAALATIANPDSLISRELNEQADWCLNALVALHYAKQRRGS